MCKPASCWPLTENGLLARSVHVRGKQSRDHATLVQGPELISCEGEQRRNDECHASSADCWSHEAKALSESCSEDADCVVATEDGVAGPALLVFECETAPMLAQRFLQGRLMVWLTTR